MSLEIITPAIAKTMLDAHDRSGQLQRVPNKRNIRRLVKVMTDGHFYGRFAAPIAITDSGGIINGRHRLLAVIESGVPQEMRVERGADPDVFKYIDNIGKDRGNADVLKLNGNAYSTEKASAFKAVDIYNSKSLNIGQSSDITGYEAIEAIENYGDEYVDAFARAAKVINTHIRFSKSIALSALIIGFEGDKANVNLLDEWVDGVCFSNGLYENDPRALLARYSLSSKIGTKGSSSETVKTDFFIWIHLWNKWVAGAPVKKLPSTKNMKFTTITPITAYNEDR